MTTLDDAIAEIVAKTPLESQDILDLIDAAGDPGGVETLMRVYKRQGRGPDISGWQTAVAVLGTVIDVAEKVAPLIPIIMQIAPLL